MILVEHKSWLEVSASSLVHNYQVFKLLARPAAVMAVVKANAYGHGLAQTVEILEKLTDVPWYGVDNVDEALAIRRLGVDKPVLILGYTPKSRLKEAIAQGISFTAYSVEALREAERHASAKHPAKIHLKIETGLQRQGVSIETLATLLKIVKRSDDLWLEGASTHYANIEDTRDPAYAMAQLEAFQRALDEMQRQGLDPAWKHTACSAAAILYPQTHYNLIRLGISLYGYWSSSETRISAQERKIKLDLKPALTWKTIVAQVKEVSRGQSVGYGLTERLTRDSKIAVLPVGYSDGFDRVAMSGQGQLIIKGHRCRIVGRVAMNMCMADVTDIKNIKIEDEVVLLGRQGKETVTADELAGRMGSINYEVLSRLNPLTPRIVKN